MGPGDAWPYRCWEFELQCFFEWEIFLAEKLKCSFVYWILKKTIIFALVKTAAVFLCWILGFFLAGGIHPAVGRLICLGVFVSGDDSVRRQGSSVIVTEWQSFLLVSALWPHTVALPFQLHTLFETVIIEIHVFAPLSSSCTFQNVTYLVSLLSYCWLHIFKCVRLRHTRNTLFHLLWESAKEAGRGFLGTKSSLRFCDSEKNLIVFISFQNCPFRHHWLECVTPGCAEQCSAGGGGRGPRTSRSRLWCLDLFFWRLTENECKIILLLLTAT